jgi:hypothetical protein
MLITRRVAQQMCAQTRKRRDQSDLPHGIQQKRQQQLAT